MSIATDIIATYRSPRQVMRRLLGMGVREDRALIYLMLGCGLVFVAQWPRLARQAQLDESVPLDALLGGALLGWLFLAPLGLYAIAAASRAIASLLGGRGSWFSARLALFWSLLAASPLWLLTGLTAGVLGPGAAQNLTGLLALATFLIFWLMSLLETERPASPPSKPQPKVPA